MKTITTPIAMYIFCSLLWPSVCTTTLLAVRTVKPHRQLYSRVPCFIFRRRDQECLERRTPTAKLSSERRNSPQDRTRYCYDIYNE